MVQELQKKLSSLQDELENILDELTNIECGKLWQIVPPQYKMDDGRGYSEFDCETYQKIRDVIDYLYYVERECDK